jgi:hypothetical protein
MLTNLCYRFIRRITLAIAVSIVGACATPALSDCPDYILSEQELTSILGGTFGALSPYVLDHSVRVRAAEECYLYMHLRLAIKGIEICQVSGCSIAVADGKRLGIREFEVQGCDAIFSRISRKVGTTFADVSGTISQHCGSASYRIHSITPESQEGVGRIRLRMKTDP